MALYIVHGKSAAGNGRYGWKGFYFFFLLKKKKKKKKDLFHRPTPTFSIASVRDLWQDIVAKKQRDPRQTMPKIEIDSKSLERESVCGTEIVNAPDPFSLRYYNHFWYCRRCVPLPAQNTNYIHPGREIGHATFPPPPSHSVMGDEARGKNQKVERKVETKQED